VRAPRFVAGGQSVHSAPSPTCAHGTINFFQEEKEEEEKFDHTGMISSAVLTLGLGELEGEPDTRVKAKDARPRGILSAVGRPLRLAMKGLP